jgi:hypothetical protein
MLPEYLESVSLARINFFAFKTTKGSISGLISLSLKMHKTGLFQTNSDKNLPQIPSLKQLFNYIATVRFPFLQ